MQAGGAGGPAQGSSKGNLPAADWMCTVCGCNNFARRTMCFQVGHSNFLFNTTYQQVCIVISSPLKCPSQLVCWADIFWTPCGSGI
jgi:hypothetical protein